MNIQKETNITWIHMDFFIFIYSLLAVMVTVTAFQKSSGKNLFLKVVFLGTSKNLSYYTGLSYNQTFICLPVPEIVLSLELKGDAEVRLKKCVPYYFFHN